MLRRDFVRTLLAAMAAPKLLLGQQAAAPAPPPPAPVPWLLGLTPETPIPKVSLAEEVAATQLRFFSPPQMATLTRLSDVLLPPQGGKPGAVQAQTPMFLDFMLSRSPQTRQQLYARGLDWLEAEAQAKYAMPFAKLDAAQSDALLKPWLRTWMNDHPPAEAHADFLNIAHDDIRTSTVNSKVWSEVPEEGAQPRTEAQLYWLPIQPDVLLQHTECGVPPHVQAVPKSTHPMPVYPR